jgi:integrase
MAQSMNFNHPKKGSQIKVEPIRVTKDIKNIKMLLSNKPRDLALFTLGINTNLRASDLLRLTVNQVRHLNEGEALEINEKKTGKPRRITLNKACIIAIQALLEAGEHKGGDYLFKSQRGAVLTVSTVSNMVKAWCKEINLKGNYGSNTLRKTWGYHQRVSFGTDLPTLMVCYNHSTQKQTLDYLCIQPEEIRDVFMNVL